ncbi:MAG: mercury(II) reductase [Acidimicrobiales bacterium]
MSNTTHTLDNDAAVKQVDLAIIGSGSAAFATAIAATRLRASVVLVEHGRVGGTCVNVGCVPSKALLAAADARHGSLATRFPGVTAHADPVDMPALIAGKDALVDTLRREKYEDLATLYGFEVARGHARFRADGSLDVDGRTIVAENYVIATGAAPWAPPLPGLEEAGFLTSTSAMDLDHVPASLVVVGANAVGLEQSQLFARLGSTVTVVEALPRIAPFEEPEVSAALSAILTSEGVSVYVSSTVTSVSRNAEGVVITLDTPEGPRQLRADDILVATGRRPVTSELGLEAVKVATGPRGEVVVDEHLRTTNPRIFAAGDVTGLPQFVYVAGAHGAVVAENALTGAQRTVDYRALPRVTFTSPQIASVGLTDAQAEDAGIDCECRVLSLENVPRAIVNRDTRGIAKIVAERTTGRVLGIHLLAEGAGDVILAGVYALEANFTVDQLATVWTPYLTMGEAIKLTAQSFTRDVAELSCCAA